MTENCTDNDFDDDAFDALLEAHLNDSSNDQTNTTVSTCSNGSSSNKDEDEADPAFAAVHLNDSSNDQTTTTASSCSNESSSNKDEEEADPCPICLGELPLNDGPNSTLMTCCGKFAHTKCVDEHLRFQKNQNMKFTDITCIMCRTLVSGSAEEEMARLQKWVEKGLHWAQQMMATDLCEKKDYVRSAELYLLSANQNNGVSQSCLGTMYDQGLGVEQSFVQAFHWYEKGAVEQHNDVAQYNLGSLYEDGQGCVQSLSKAVEFYKLSADQGYSQAQRKLAGLYSEGRGVVQSDEMAAKFLAAAGPEACCLQ